MIAGVLVELSNKNIDKIFEYSVSKEQEENIRVGIRVLVPFGNMQLEGFVLSLKYEKTTDKELKKIISIIDENVILNEELLSLGKELSKNTLATLISCYQVMLPKALKAKRGTTINKKYKTFYRLNENFLCDKVSPKQQEIIKILKEKGFVLKQELELISKYSLQTLEKNKIIIKELKEDYRLTYGEGNNKIKHKLTDEQKIVVNEVINNKPNNYLLCGVTGSGKTEVYMEIIEYYLSQNKTSIVLVPEISLTPQMVRRFEERFGSKIAAIHSALSDGEKYDEWRRIERGEASIVIGARSAIFAPLENIGVIIVDEEHSDSYKQSDPNPRYNAKDIALLRAKKHNCSVIFGSATPSIEDMARAQKKVYKLLQLPNRVNGKRLPNIKIIDMNYEIKRCTGHFSEQLINEIKSCLERNEQIILLLNRRGYSTFISCKKCGYTFKCPNCDITLTYHKNSNVLRCHYCGYADKMHDTCPSCKEKSLSNIGTGTEKIEEELNDIFPQAKVLRMDYDTTTKKGSHNKMINDFKNLEYDILLGTQMVAKGLDFSNVTLVGVINADTSLNIPDFRSNENTFSLLSQVAGRSGRSEKEGQVIIQTYNKDHYAIALVKKHDYPTFYKKEMLFRKQLKYPPYYYLCMIKVSGKDNDYLLIEARKIKDSLERNTSNTIILGPNIASIFKINNVYRYNIIIKHRSNEELNDTLSKIVEHYKTNNKIKVDIDFNPSQIM